MANPKVFISYSHDSPDHSERVLSLAWALQGNGIDVELDQFHNEEILDWPRWCNEQTSHEHSEFVVCVCTPEYRQRIEGKVPPEKGKGVHWEGSLLDDDLYDEKDNRRVIAILFDEVPDTSIPRFLRGWTQCRLRQFALSDPGYEQLIRILTHQAKVEKNPLGAVPVLPRKRAQPTSIDELRVPRGQGRENISIARLPVTGKELIGREEDIAFLNDAWSNPDVNVVTIVAWAGVGKSTLINHWLRRMAAEHYRSAQLVFGWSFYRQGSSGDTSSADEFLDAALSWFGDPDPRTGTAWEKGERLAELITKHRTLLVLDGLEPLQNPPGPQEGRLREPSLQALLRELAASNTGLCVITTRLPVGDLADHERTSVRRRDLNHLSSEAGAKLLLTLGVKGPDAELRRASDEFSGHCLALTLLGSYLTDACEAKISRRKEVHLFEDQRKGDHAQRVMASYQTWFGEGPELSVLRMLGFFDRPADEKAIQALLKPPAICGLTESLTGLSPHKWQIVLSKLRRARLLAEEDPHSPHHLDTHPLVREYFGESFQTSLTDAWSEGNRRLFEHYRTLAPDLPATFHDMEPLFLAVICGCNAARFHEALHEVYLRRIQRGDASFAAKILGATGPLLSALSHFFEDENCGRPIIVGVDVQSLTPEDQLFILMQAGMYLMATRGMGATEVGICYQGAEVLCRSLNRPLLLYYALMGQWQFSFFTDSLRAAMEIAQRVKSLAKGQNNVTMVAGACGILAAQHYFMGKFNVARRYATRGVQVWRRGSPAATAAAEGEISAVVLNVPGVICLCFEALCKWHLGEVGSSETTVVEAVSVARKLDDAYALTESLCFAALLVYFDRNAAKVDRLALDLIEQARHNNFGLYVAAGEILHGWARSASGYPLEGLASIEGGLRDFQETGAMLLLPYWLALKAEALYLASRTREALKVIMYAQELVEKSGERCNSAELHRLHGVFLTALGAEEAENESFFGAAVKIANEQKSCSLVARAEATCAEYRSQKARVLGGHGFRLSL